MALQLFSTVKSSGTLELSLRDVPEPEPKENEVVVRIDATPINPSDLGLLFGAADKDTVEVGGTPDRPVVTARIPESAMGAMAGRLDQSLPVGNEGAGTVMKAGSAAAAQALMGNTVSIYGGAMYAQYRVIEAAQCLPLPDGVKAVQGASWWVNPMTAQGMTETMRMEGHTALVHTAAASNLGQMLLKLCQADGIDLVNIVRKPEQVELLKGLGAKYVCNLSEPDFMDSLTDALAETSATLAFDAISGGKLAGQILTAMEAAIQRTATEYNRYGSAVHKQVYIYGTLDKNPTSFSRSFGAAWGMGGWLLPLFLRKAGPEVTKRLRDRVAAEITTTFASSYTREVTLPEMLSADAIAVYGKQSTGDKFLIRPNGKRNIL